jgi:hypothetical protein
VAKTTMQLLINAQRYKIEKAFYDNKRIAYVIKSEYGEPFMKLTVNLPGLQLERGEFAVKTWGENEPYIQYVLASGHFIDTGKRAASGFCEASIWKLKKAEK